MAHDQADQQRRAYEHGVCVGYRDGQADILDYLRGELDEVDAAIALEFCLWCLGHNLAIVGALKKADMNGKAAATAWNNGGGYRQDVWDDPGGWRTKKRIEREMVKAAQGTPSKIIIPGKEWWK